MLCIYLVQSVYVHIRVSKKRRNAEYLACGARLDQRRVAVLYVKQTAMA